jgi:hypothetical protein
LCVVNSICKLRLTNLSNTNNVQVMLNVLFKFLIILRACSKSIKFVNITLGLEHRHNNLESLKSLIESLESYFKLLIKLITRAIIVLFLV